MKYIPNFLFDISLLENLDVEFEDIVFYFHISICKCMPNMDTFERNKHNKFYYCNRFIQDKKYCQLPIHFVWPK